MIDQAIESNQTCLGLDPRSKKRRIKQIVKGNPSTYFTHGHSGINAIQMRKMILTGVLLIILVSTCVAAERTLLWHVIQACVTNHRLFGADYPCLEVKIDKDSDAGFAVLKAPFEMTHVIITPTTRVFGIESESLLENDVPNYVQEAWNARHYVGDGLGRPLAWDALGLAINSAKGRSQDQLHIHLDCVQSDVRKVLQGYAAFVSSNRWERLKTPLRGVRYWVTFLDNPDLANVNIIRLAISGLHIQREDHADLSVALIGAISSNNRRGFYLLADLTSDFGNRPTIGAHAEFLLDHSCKGIPND